jgi:fructokinase
MKKLYGGMEGGGTKFVCAVGDGRRGILETVQFPTTTPGETLEKAISFFQGHRVSAVGLAPFGPLDLDPSSPSYGSITATPKPGWAGTEVMAAFRSKMDIPLAFELDVNASAFGEFSLVAENQGLKSLVYFTIGTGIGAGVIQNSKIIHGLTHPEVGHLRLPHNRKLDPFPGICPFHGDCFEGLASGPALARRWRNNAETLPAGHPAWELEAAYIAFAVVNIILTVSPERIVLGGGVMKQRTLFPAIRSKVRTLLNGYLPSPVYTGTMEGFIVQPALGHHSAVLGAMALARKAASAAAHKSGS